MFSAARPAKPMAINDSRPASASRRHRRTPSAPRSRRRTMGAEGTAAPVSEARPPVAATERVSLIVRFAERGAVASAAWRRSAWRLLGEARVARAAGDGKGCQLKLAEVRRLRRRAAKTGAFARMCARRAARLTLDGGPHA